MSEKQLVAVDSCAIIEMFLVDDEQKAQTVRALFEDPSFQIVIPTIVGVEVVATPHMRRGKHRAPIVTPEIQEARAFLEGCGAYIAELDARSMRLAGELGPSLVIKPADSAVLATAITSGCQKLFTYDQQLIRKSANLTEIKVCPPPPPVTLFTPGE